MATVTNAQLLKELLKTLDDMDYFNLYPSRRDLKIYIQEGVSATDKIRRILNDEYVQREIFPNWHKNKQYLDDPVAAYKDMRLNPRWPEHEEE